MTRSVFPFLELTAENGKIKITAQNECGQVSQIHNIIDHPKNNLPVLTKTIAEVFSGESIGIQLGFYDPDGPGPYVFSILKEPEHGHLSGNGNDRIYTPNSGFPGTDQFIWSVNDGFNDAEKVTVIIHVKNK